MVVKAATTTTTPPVERGSNVAKRAGWLAGGISRMDRHRQVRALASSRIVPRACVKLCQAGAARRCMSLSTNWWFARLARRARHMSMRH